MAALSTQVNRLTKKHLIILLYETVGPKGYSNGHVAVKKLQNFIEKEFSMTFGYSFDDLRPLRFDIYDEELEDDLERYEAFEDLLHIDAGECKEKGKFLFGTNVQSNLERQFGGEGFERIKDYLKRGMKE